MIYLLFFLLAFAIALGVTPIVRAAAVKWNVLDLPNQARKIHGKPIPFLGGVAVFFSFLTALLVYIFLARPDFNIVPVKFFCGIIFGGLVLIIGGALDDKFNLPPKILWLFPAIASAIVVWSGIGVGIKEITNPFGGPQISIDYSFSLLSVINFKLSVILVWLWMMGMIFTTKFLDGLDGLCGGIAFVGGLTIFAISLGPNVNQPITANLAIIFSGALLGYLIYAFNPATIFLGESGSTFAGFTLGVLSVILGAKIATALLVMGIPILDVVWVIFRRLWYGKSPFKGDRQHLHFRLLDIGFTQKQAVLFLCSISAIFGTVAVFLQSMGKLIALLLLGLVMLVLAITTVILYKRKHPHIPDLFDYAENKPIDEKPEL